MRHAISIYACVHVIAHMYVFLPNGLCFALPLEPKTDMSTHPPRPGSVLQRHGSGFRLVHIRALAVVRHPVQVYTAMIDEVVDERGYIIPGLGDAGDRAYGTPH